MNNQPIELNRRFNLVENDDDSGKSAEDAQREAIENFISGHYPLPGVSWAELLEMPRVVILAEAGAGKSAELWLRAKTLRNEGKNAFCCQMESIAEEKDFRTALLPEEEKRFNKWLKGEDVGYFFVDSLDESKLRDFSVDSALRPLKWALKDAEARVRIYISSRASEWDPGKDFTDFCNCWGDSPRVAFLRSLDFEQQELLVGELGLQDGKKMLESARKIGDFLVNRPLDLRATAEYWRKHQRIASHMKMMEHSVSENLHERNPKHAKKRALDLEKARCGADSLAAALILCQKSRIRTPSSAFERTDGMEPHEMLSDWSAGEISALLDRPIFDPEIYGAVRFHHREVREYMAAHWFKRMLGGGALPKSILLTFEATKYGEFFVYPAMRPVAAWLAQMENGEGKFSRRMLELDPIAMMTHGDPSVLSPKFRGNVLRAAAKKIASNLETESIYNISLERFGNADIANVVNELLDTFSGNPEAVEFLLQVVRAGKITQCAEKALDIALNQSTVKDLRRPAIDAVIDASAKHAKILAKEVVNQADKWAGRDLTRAMLRLFPKSMNIGQFVQCIEKKAGSWERLGSDSYLLENISLEGMTPKKLREFLNGILAAAKARTKRSGGWAESLTATLVAKALMPLLDSSNAPHKDEGILCAIEALGKYQGMGCSERYDVAKKISADWRIVHTLYWRAFQQKCSIGWVGSDMSGLSNNPELFRAFLLDLQTQSDTKKREEAFHIIWLFWHPYGPEKSGVLAEIRAALAGDNAMLQQLDKRLEGAAKLQRQQEQRTKSHKERERKEKEQKEKELRESVGILQTMSSQLCDFDPEVEVPPDVVRALLYLQQWMRDNNEPTSIDKSDSDNCSYHWESMIPVFGKEVARCAHDGMMQFWRTYTPALISEVRGGRSSWNTDSRVSLGSLGLDMLHQQQPDWTAKLTTDEAIRAARYATHSHNRFPEWFPVLVSKHQEAVDEVMRPEMEKDIRQFADNASPNILSAMLHNAETHGQSFALMALDILEANPAMGQNARHYVARLLRSLKDGNPAERKIDFYRKRIAEIDDINERAFWLAEWMRVDASVALEELEHYLQDISNLDDARKFMINFCGGFGNETHGHNTQGLREVGIWGNVGLLLKMLRLTLAHVRYEDDNKHDGVYSPDTRDHAEHFRGALLNHLVTECSGKEAYRAMMKLSADTALDEHTRGVLRVYARRCAERETRAEFPFESPAEVTAFAKKHTPPFGQPGVFFQYVLSVLEELQDDLENGDFSNASLLVRGNEDAAQLWFADRLREKGKGLFTVACEEETIHGNKPDIRVRSVKGDCVVSIEMKIANNWSFHQLQDALETQLPQYLRDPKARHGILLLVNKGGKEWEILSRLANFTKLTDVLGNQAKELVDKKKGIDDIRVIGVDLSTTEKPNPPPRSPRKKASKVPSAKSRKRKT